MTTLKRPGVFLEERPPLIVPPAGTVSTSAGALLGAANRGPTTPTLVTSYSDFAKLFGDVSSTASELAFHAYAFFANGGSQLYACRVAGTGAAAATRTLTDRAATPVSTLVVNAANVGAWGNDLYVDISDTAGQTGYFDIVVYYGGTTNAYAVERFSGLSMTATDPKYALSVVNNTSTGSRYITLAQPNTPSATAAPLNNPSVQTGVRLTNGTDGSAPADGDFSTALTGYDAVLDGFNLGLPGASVAQQNLAVTYASTRGDVFVVCELPTATTQTSAAAITAAGAFTASSYGAVYWPNLTVNDPSSTAPGATRTQTPTGAILGLISLTDSSRGIQKAPAGTAARLAGALAPQVLLNSTDLDNLNVAQVNAIRLIPGSGVVVMGARTLKPGASDRYVPIRRTLNYVKKNVIELSRFAIFEPNTSVTRAQVASTIDAFLRDCWHKGLFKGASTQQAYYVTCDSTNNTTTSISQGIVNVEIGVSLVTPAEYIVISIGQFENGATSVTGG